MMKTKISAQATHWIGAALVVAAMTCGIGPTATKAQAASVSVGIGIGVPGPYYGPGPYGRYPYWGPRPYWYSAYWYHPYYYWGPSLNFYAGFPVDYVSTWPDPVRTYHRDAFSAALSGPIGQPFGWNDGYDTGSAMAVRDGHSGANYCREIRQDVTVGSRHESAMSAACRFPDGTWHMVQDNP